MPVKDSKEPLTPYACKGGNDGVGIFHETSWSFRLYDGALEREMVGESIFFTCAHDHLPRIYPVSEEHGHMWLSADWETGGTVGSVIKG